MIDDTHLRRRLGDAYADLSIPPFPATALAAARAQAPPRRPVPALRFALASVAGLLFGATVTGTVLFSHHAASPSAVAERPVDLDRAQRLAGFPLVVPDGMPVRSASVEGAPGDRSVHLVVEPRLGERMTLIERPGSDGATSITVDVPGSSHKLRQDIDELLREFHRAQGP
jgi:hypothetical protein